MNDDFAKIIKSMDLEILALKTAQPYGSTATAGVFQLDSPEPGTYQVNYGSGAGNVLSIISWDGVLAAFTPNDDTQRLVFTNVRSVRIISNRPILSIEKVS